MAGGAAILWTAPSGVYGASLWSLWPVASVAPEKPQSLNPMAKLRTLWAMNPVKDLWPKVPPKTTRSKYRREDRPFLYKAGLLAIPL